MLLVLPPWQTFFKDCNQEWFIITLCSWFWKRVSAPSFNHVTPRSLCCAVVRRHFGQFGVGVSFGFCVVLGWWWVVIIDIIELEFLNTVTTVYPLTLRLYTTPWGDLWIANRRGDFRIWDLAGMIQKTAMIFLDEFYRCLLYISLCRNSFPWGAVKRMFVFLILRVSNILGRLGPNVVEVIRWIGKASYQSSAGVTLVIKRWPKGWKMVRKGMNMMDCTFFPLRLRWFGWGTKHHHPKWCMNHYRISLKSLSVKFSSNTSKCRGFDLKKHRAL